MYLMETFNVMLIITKMFLTSRYFEPNPGDGRSDNYGCDRTHLPFQQFTKAIR